MEESQESTNEHTFSQEGQGAETPQSPANLVSDVVDAVDDSSEHAVESADKDLSESDLLLAKMTTGFLALRDRKKEVPRIRLAAGNGRTALPIYSHAIVSVIDPTSTGGATVPNDSSVQQKFIKSPLAGGKSAINESFLSRDLYENFSAIFTRNFDCTLHSIPYESIRGGATGTIQNLPVQTILTRSYGAVETAAPGDVPWGGTAGAGAALTDPAEWHNSPHCHVFIAACEGVEHYRTKVRPALQAFVSQIEAASGSATPATARGSGLAAKIPMLNGGCSAHYVIIYVPIRTKDSGASFIGHSPATISDVATSGSRIGAGIASRLTAARRQIQSNTSREMSDSMHSGGTNSTDFEIDFSDSGSGSSNAFITKTEKEILKKFVVDFPNGRPCVMSTLTEPIEGVSATLMHPLKSQEWANFLRTMASAIVNGFQDRCRRYDDELRRLEAVRTGLGNKNDKVKSGELSTFDLNHFFLVKESLAFTYEQMQLPAEALLQYEELRLFLPGSVNEKKGIAMNDSTGKRKEKKSSPSTKLVDDFDEEARKLAIAGDTIGFRRRLRSMTDIESIEQLVLQYIFAREIDLLFQLDSPIVILERALEFVASMYQMKLKGVGLLEKKNPSEVDTARRKKEAEEWALDFSWDVKRACDVFFRVLEFENDNSFVDFSFNRIDLDTTDIEDLDALDVTTGKSEVDVDPEQESLERAMASKLCDILEFARLRYLQLGDSQLAVANPIRELWNGTPKDMMQDWVPWEAGTTNVAITRNENGSLRSFKAAIAFDEESSFIASQNKIARLSEGACHSKESYEERYLELSTVIANFCRQAGRNRLASRLQAERAELHMRNKEYKLAVRALLPVINSCASDRWDRGHFWRLFRLASCQRMTGKVASYLNTLTQCFGPQLSSIAPPKAADALQRDFELIVANESLKGFRLGIASFLETDMEVGATASGKTSILLNFVHKKLVKTFCNVGEDIKVVLTVTSYLPRSIEIKKLSVLLVSLEKYEDIFHRRAAATNEDAFQILNLESPITLDCGPNNFEFHWKPMTTGQFVLSTVQLQWNNSCFHYDSAVIRKPISGIEVLPSAPTQSIELNPLFLIPGQIQLVRITFNPGSDVVEKGTVELICSNGLQVIPPGADPKSEQWSETCTVDLPPTKPGQPVVLTTLVKSSMIKTIEQKLGLHSRSDSASVVTGHVQTMQAKVTTSYHHAQFSKVDGVIDTCMETALEAMVTTLDKPAFTVDQSEAFIYNERILINVSLHCNTPVPFYIKEWSLKLPKLCVTDDGDMNQNAFIHAVAEGEQLSFCFNCLQAETEYEEVDAPFLLIVLQDEFGKTFNQVLPLDLDSLYDKMRQNDEFSRMNSVTTELKLPVTQGLVGAPVSLVYRVDASSLSKPKRKNSMESSGGTGDDFSLKYMLSYEGTDWIVGGKTLGILSCVDVKEFMLEFVGIPIHPGVIKTFPSLRVAYDSTEGHDVPRITVHSRNPDLFNSLAFVNHVALACSAGLEAY